ncbi:MAG: iron ABC transporter permease [Flavobacteriaceae bacterium]|nr:iron ABC transporter permease [Flavobacteriaceae bacterium]
MKSDFVKEYKNYNKRRLTIIFALLILLLLSIQVALLIGSFEVNFQNIKDFWTDENSTINRVITQIRMPRVVASVLTGAVLSVAGVVSQSLMRNPLASPFTLGISSSSAFGAAFAILFLVEQVGAYSQYIIGFSAFLWSMVSIVLIIILSRMKNSNPQTIILSGVVLSALFSAGISALQYFANDVQLANMVFWSFGDMGRSGWEDIALVFGCFCIGFIYFMKKSWSYNLLKTGDDYAKSLGINPEKIRLQGMILASLITALTVAFYGMIGFVGLLGPHIMRRIIGNNEMFLIPSSAVFGALLLLLADTFARTIISPIILPVGIVTSFLGAPLFIYLLIKSKH